MKKSLLIAGIAAAVMMSSSLTYAATNTPQDTKTQTKYEKKMPCKCKDCKCKKSPQVKRQGLDERLNLTEEQKQKAHEIRMNGHEKMKPVFEKMKAKKAEIKEIAESDLSQAEKVMLRYAYVLEATKNAQGDFQRTSNSWANQIRILKEQWNQLLTIIGQALTKILGPVVQFLNKILSQVITIANAISKAFANIFGTKETTMKVETNADTSQADKNFGNTTEAVEGTTEAVEDLNKQLDLASFDEIERIGQLKDEQEEDAGDFNLDIGEIEIEESEVGDGLIDQIGERLQSILDTIAEAIKNFKDRIPKLDLQFDIDKFLDNLTRLVNAFITAFGNILTAAATFAINLANAINWDAVFTNLTNAAISAISILETIFVTAFTLLDKIAQDIQLGAIITQITALIAAFMNLADVIVSTLAPALIAFYDTGLKPIVEWMGEKLLDAISFSIGILDDWANWFTENTSGIQNFGVALGQIVQAIWAIIEPLANVIWEQFKEIILLINEGLQMLGEYLLNEFIPGLQEFLTQFIEEIGPAMIEFAQNISKILEYRITRQTPFISAASLLPKLSLSTGLQSGANIK